MLRKKNVKFLSLVSLVLLLMITSTVPSFASNDIVSMNSGSGIEVEVINNNNVMVIENNNRSLITQEHSKYETKTIVRNLETGTEDYFLRNEANATIYSSMTGETLSIIESIDYEDEIVNMNFISRDGRFVDRHSITYATLNYLVTGAASAATVAAAILAYKGLVKAAGIAGIIAALTAAINHFTFGKLLLHYPKGGILYDVYEVKKTVRNGYVYGNQIRNARHRSVM